MALTTQNAHVFYNNKEVTKEKRQMQQQNKAQIESK